MVSVFKTRTRLGGGVMGGAGAAFRRVNRGEKRKFACELCDFSATTLKSLRFHRRVHDRFGVGPATLTDPHGNGILTVG
ncbi:hypothetical protein ANCDUO_19910, partial [Ancylostoma duodenale]